MARSQARRITLKCVNCGQNRGDFWWSGDRAEEWNATAIAQACSVCSTAHWEIDFGTGARLSARGTQGKAVVYMLPDGDYMSVDTNTPAMVETAATVGVRREFGSLKEVRDFCKNRAKQKVEAWKREADEGLYGVTTPDFKQWAELDHIACMNDVLNYDEKTIREKLGHMGEVMAERRRIHDATMKRFRPARDGSIQLPGGARMRIGGPQDKARYDRLRGRR